MTCIRNYINQIYIENYINYKIMQIYLCIKLCKCIFAFSEGNIFVIDFIFSHLGEAICFIIVKRGCTNKYYDVDYTAEDFSFCVEIDLSCRVNEIFASDVRLSFNRRQTVRRGKGKSWLDKWNWSISSDLLYRWSLLLPRTILSGKVWNCRFVYL